MNVFLRHDFVRSLHSDTMRGVRSCLLTLALLLAPGLAQAAYRTVIDAPAPLKALLTEFLDLARYQERADMNDEQLNFMIATASEQVARLAATEGYFSPKTTVNLEKNAAQPVVHVTVAPGKRTVVEKLTLDISGAVTARSPAQAEELRRGWSLRSGAPFRQADWASAKQEALDVLTRRRYPGARLVDSQARVDADANAAALSASYDSGPLFSLGALRVSGTRRYPESIVRNLNPLHAGEEYSVDRLLEFQRQVLRTPYFSNVVIDIDRNPENASAAPVVVEVTEFPTQRIRGGAGYTSDTGLHVEGLYSNADMFGRAYVLDAQLRLEQRRQFGTLTLSKPPEVDGFIDSAHISTDRTTLAGVDLRSRRLGVRRARESDRTQTAYTLEYYSDRLTQLNGAMLPANTVVEPGTHQAVVLGVERTLRRVDSLVFPREAPYCPGKQVWQSRASLPTRHFFGSMVGPRAICRLQNATSSSCAPSLAAWSQKAVIQPSRHRCCFAPVAQIRCAATVFRRSATYAPVRSIRHVFWQPAVPNTSIGCPNSGGLRFSMMSAPLSTVCAKNSCSMQWAPVRGFVVRSVPSMPTWHMDFRRARSDRTCL